MILGEASDVGKWELEQEVMEHHVVPRTTIWGVGTCEAPHWGFPEITCVGGRYVLLEQIGIERVYLKLGLFDHQNLTSS